MAASRRCSSWPPSGITKAMALRRSGLTSTAVSVIEAPRSSGSRMSPRSSNSASRWRSSSPTLSWRWLGPFLSRSDGRRRVIGNLLSSPYDGDSSPSRNPRRGGTLNLQRRLDFLDVEALDDVADLDVVVVLERHAALEAVLHLADLVLEAAQGLQRAFVDHHVVT